MSEKTRLEIEGSQIRKDIIINKNDFNSKTEVYSEEHDSAKTHNDETHPLGKGTGHGGHTHTTPKRNASKADKERIDRTQIDTENGGGSHDIFGYNNAGGRINSLRINIYNSENQYSKDLIDVSESEMSEIDWK
jgi:hypothetical protein